MSDKPSIWKVNDWEALAQWARSRWIAIVVWFVSLLLIQIPAQLTIPKTDMPDESVPLPFLFAMLFFAVGFFVLLGFGLPVMQALIRCTGLRKQ
tara:strand:+ start:1753 stop:2034 length:282 start_codon:yes stop_codon:yes gene_type:complete